jgi:hypothetical protein
MPQQESLKMLAPLPSTRIVVARALTRSRMACQLRDLIGAIGNDPKLADFTTTHPFGDRNRNRRLMDIQSHEIGCPGSLGEANRPFAGRASRQAFARITDGRR